MRKIYGTPTRRKVVPEKREIRKYSKNISKFISESDIGLFTQILRRIYADFTYRRRRICVGIRLKIHPQEILLRKFYVNYTLILHIDGADLRRNSIKKLSVRNFTAQILRRLYADFAYRRRRVCAEIRLKVHP
jgi:hypothetical protein